MPSLGKKTYVKLYLLLYNMITSYKYIKPLDIDNKKDKNYVYIKNHLTSVAASNRYNIFMNYLILFF